MIGAVVRFMCTRLWPRDGIGKEKGKITQMVDRMNTTRVLIAGPDTIITARGSPHRLLTS
jgi:hypothetical protein